MIVKDDDEMKGKEIIDSIVLDKMPDFEQVRENCKQQTLPHDSHVTSRKSPVLRSAAMLAAITAIVCLAVATVMSLSRNGDINPAQTGDNVFTLKAYALDNGDNSTVEMSDNTVLDRASGAIGHFNEESGTASILVKLDWYGENIRSVMFIVNEGFFVYHVHSDQDEDLFMQEKAMKYGEPSQIVPYEIFERQGDNTILIDEETLAGEVLLFWTLGPVTEDATFPQEIVISAKATFYDSTTGDQVLSFDSSKVYTTSLRSIVEFSKMKEYYLNINLDKCEVVPESVMPTNGIYEFVVQDQPNHRLVITFPVEIDADYIQQYQPFDEDGVFRFSFDDKYGNDFDRRGYLAVIVLKDDGGMTGMVYRTPMRQD